MKVYPEAGHSFMNDSDGLVLIKAVGRPILAVGYHPESADDAWVRILSFFEIHLGVRRRPRLVTIIPCRPVDVRAALAGAVRG